jgi:hypothetical protein
VEPAPNNQFQIALYRDNNGAPGALMTVSEPQAIVPDAWNTVSFATTVLPNSFYWLAYNANGTSAASDNFRFTTTGQSAWLDNVPFGSWPVTVHATGQSQCTMSVFLMLRGGSVITSDGGGGRNVQLGYPQDPDPYITSVTFNTDNGDSNRITLTRVTNDSTYNLVPSAGESVSLSVYVATAPSAPPNNVFNVAVYSDQNGAPGALIGTSDAASLSGGAWVTVPLFVPIEAGKAYWLAFNTNGTSPGQNDGRIMTPAPHSNDDKPNLTEWIAAPFGSFPSTVQPTGSTSGVMSIYLDYIIGAVPGR